VRWNLYGTIDGLFITDLNGEDAAKAAAQADYEARIIAALDTPAPAMGELVEAQQGVTDLIARLLVPCQSEHTYDADKEEAAKALKAYEKETAVWSENYAALERKVAELTRERDNFANLYDETLSWVTRCREQADRAEAAEAKLARLEGALRGLLSAVDAWAETPPRSDAEMEASFPVYAAAETARAALAMIGEFE
jgi:septal ring factor EnvC (AmiA/AmiB activator)